MGKRTTTHRVNKPSLPPELITDVAKLFIDQQKEREQRRLDVFQRAWDATDAVDQRVVLAVAYLSLK